jgi:hypothetical protein
MNAEVMTAALLIAVPLAFNAAFFELGRALDYPNILRSPDLLLGLEERPVGREHAIAARTRDASHIRAI